MAWKSPGMIDRIRNSLGWHVHFCHSTSKFHSTEILCVRHVLWMLVRHVLWMLKLVNFHRCPWYLNLTFINPPPPRYISIMWQRLLIIPNVHQHNTKTSKSPSPPSLPPLPSPPLPSPSLPHPLPSPALPYPPFPSPPLPPSLPLSLPPSSDTTNSLSFPA